MEILLLIVGGAALIAGAIVYAGFVSGFVLFKFYNWFLLSQFAGLPEVTYMQCVAVIIFLACVRTSSDCDIKDEYKKDSGSVIAVQLLKPWLVLLVGWLFKICFL